MTHFVTTFPLRVISSRAPDTSDLDLPTTTRAGDAVFSVAVDETEQIVATAFGASDLLKQRAKLGQLVEDRRRTALAREQIGAFFAGELRDFSLPLAPKGSSFQLRVWTALQRILFGETRSYGELARQLGSAPRAVGRANATNPICLVIPCHRVIGADGSLTGFAFGEDVKRQLLDHEASFRGDTPIAGRASVEKPSAALPLSLNSFSRFDGVKPEKDGRERSLQEKDLPRQNWG